MKKITGFLFAFLVCVVGFAQGHETFDNLELEGNSYQTGSFTGQDGSTWEFVQARGDADAEITEGDQAIMLGRNRTPDAELISGTLQNGIGTLQFTYMQAFSSNVNMEVYVNDDLVYTATSDGQNGEVLQSGEIVVNVDGDFTLRFFNPEGGGQVNIDDIIWTATGDEPTLHITSPSNGHLFAPGQTPSIHFNISNFTLSSSADAGDGDGYLQYNVDDEGYENHFSLDDIVLEGLDAGSHLVELRLVDNDGEAIEGLSDSVEFIIQAFIEVSSIGELRDAELNGYYTLTSEAILTYEQNFRNQKYIQDDTGAILIDDNSGVITTSYNQYDGITGISGKLNVNNGLMQLQPTDDPGDATSSDNSISPVVITIADLMDDPDAYESQIIALENIEFILEDGEDVFEVGHNYTVADENGDTTIMRTNFYDADYIGDEIPLGVQDVVVGIAARFYDDGQFFIRDNNDLQGGPMSSPKHLKQEISIYPNPAKSHVNIEIDGEAQVDIYSVLGQKVISTRIQNKQTLDVDNLVSGIYLVKITQNGKTFAKKLVVQ